MTAPLAHKIRKPFHYVPAVGTDITQSPAWVKAAAVAKAVQSPVLTFPTKPKEGA